MRGERKTLTRYTIEAEHRHPGSTGDFSGYLAAMASEEMEDVYPIPVKGLPGCHQQQAFPPPAPLAGVCGISANT